MVAVGHPFSGWNEARHPQIVVLSLLLCAQLAWLDFGASAPQAAVTIAATLATQWACCKWLGLLVDWRSPVIAGLSLSLLLRSHDPAVWVAAGMVGIGSKFLFRIDGKHVFNPACFAIVTMVLGGWAWVSPGHWGVWAWAALLVGGGGAVVLGRPGGRIRRWHSSPAMPGCWRCDACCSATPGPSRCTSCNPARC